MDTEKTWAKTKDDVSDIKLADEYDITPENYKDINLKNIGLSIGAINHLMREGVYTVCDLLNLSERDLYGIKNIGGRSVELIREVIENLIRNDKRTYVKRSIDGIVKGKVHISDISEKDRLLLKKYKEAATIVGYEISKEAYFNPDKIVPIIKSLNSYSKSVINSKARLNELEESFNRIPRDRHSLFVYPFIEAYTNDVQKTLMLKEIFNQEDTISDILNKYKDLKQSLYNELNLFTNWLSFDIEEICDSYLGYIFNEEGVRDIVIDRVNGLPIRIICEKLNVEVSKGYRVEKMIAKNLRAMQNKYNLIKMIIAVNRGESIIREEVLENNFGKYKDIFIHYHKRMFKDNSFIHDSSFNVYCADSKCAELLQNIKLMFPKEMDVKELEENIRMVSLDTGVPESLIKTMIINRYTRTGNLYHYGKLSNLSVYNTILKKYFPDGIKVGCNKDLELFLNKIIEYVGDIDIPKSNRLLANGIANVGVSCSRGVYIHRDYIHIPKAVIDKIEEYINESDKERICAYELYMNFSSLISKETNIQNYSTLYGVLKYELKDKYHFFRNSIILKPKERV